VNIAEHVFAALDGLRAHQEKLPSKGVTNEPPGYVLPMLVISTITGNDDLDLRGEASLRWRVMQIDAWGKTRRGTDDYMELARAQMLAYKQFSVGAIDVSGAPGYDDDANLFRASLEFRVWFTQ
jgi:hypothetical protein